MRDKKKSVAARMTDPDRTDKRHPRISRLVGVFVIYIIRTHGP